MVELTFEELEKYRQKNGHIDLNWLVTEHVEVEREVRGNDKRQKDWFDIKDGRAMFKANSEEQQYAQYSELICCELAKQAGLQTAQYDFAELDGKKGIVTKHMCKQGEEPLSINDLIGNGPTNPDYPDSTDIYFVFDELEQKLTSDGYDEDTVDKCMLDLRKQLLFDMYVMETDRHTENVSFIVGKDEKTGKPTIRLAPMYDTESSLALYDDAENMKKVWTSMMVTANVTNMQEPKMCVIPEHESIEPEDLKSPKSLLEQLQSQVYAGSVYETESEEIWKTTLDFLIEDRRVFEYLEETLSKMDIKQAIQNIEKTKKCELPDEVKNMAIACFEDRKNAIAYELGLDIEYKEKPKELT